MLTIFLFSLATFLNFIRSTFSKYKEKDALKTVITYWYNWKAIFGNRFVKKRHQSLL